MKKLTINFYLDGVTSAREAIEELKIAVKRMLAEEKRIAQASLEKDRSIFLYVRIPGSQDPVKCSTGWKCSQIHWDNGRVNKKFDVHGVNAKIELVTEWIKDSVRPSSRFNFTKEALENYIDVVNGKPERHKDITSFLNWVDSFAEKAVVAANTKKSYVTTIRYLREFEEYSRQKLNWDSFNLQFYAEFMDWLWDVKKLNDNSAGKYIKVVKTFLRHGFDQDLHKNQNFRKKQFKVLSREADEVYLDQEEINRIYSLDLSDRPELRDVRDLFVFGCWVGLRYTDLTSVKPHHIITTPNGKMIKITTGKTKETVLIPFHPTAAEIYERGLPDIRPSDNVTYNKLLKEIGEKAKIDTIVQRRDTKRGEVTMEWIPKYKMISAHSSRRSFCTNLYKMGIPSRTIMAISGHRTESAFNKYIRISKEEHASIMMEHFSKSVQMKIA